MLKLGMGLAALALVASALPARAEILVLRYDGGRAIFQNYGDGAHPELRFVKLRHNGFYYGDGGFGFCFGDSEDCFSGAEVIDQGFKIIDEQHGGFDSADNSLVGSADLSLRT